MTEPRKPGRPRKWTSDAERMRARRAAQRADRERYAQERRLDVLEATPELDGIDLPQLVSTLPKADTVLDLNRVVDLLMIACQVEGGIQEWLHQSCIEQHDQLLTALVDEQQFAREVMDEAKALDHLARRMRERLVEVDPDGPFTPKYPISAFLRPGTS